MNRPVVLAVLDGFGIGRGDEGDAIARAETPFFDRVADLYPHTEIDASGRAVGLPAGLMGNSEVGHMTLGAGRIIDQDMIRIQRALDSGDLDSNAALGGLLGEDASLANGLHEQGSVLTHPSTP